MANEAYRAVFLRVHPTGKMVLSLTIEADGNEGHYAQIVADEPWGSATPVPGSSVAMPSGYGPSRGRTTPGWSL